MTPDVKKLVKLSLISYGPLLLRFLKVQVFVSNFERATHSLVRSTRIRNVAGAASLYSLSKGGLQPFHVF